MLGIVITLSMTLINVFLILRPEDPSAVINLSEQQKKRLGPEKLEEMRIFMGRAMQWLNLVTAAMLAYLQYGSINTALGYQNGLGWGIIIFVLLELGIAGVMTKKSLDYTFYRPPVS
ncbi:MAG: hypothetical protein U9N81_06155 [Bacillota bacterium]|nr:hypothetical protein [Bacillota bacterium]